MDNFGVKCVLRNGVQIPLVGLGTWKILGRDAYNQVLEGIKLGYTHIDTASIYENEQEVGRAIQDSGVKREKLFITTKLWNDCIDYRGTIKAFNESKDRLGLEYIDLFLIHWPNPITCRQNERWKQRNIECYGAIEEMYNEGKIRAIGVSNFKEHHLRNLLESSSITPMINQMRIFPGYVDEETVEYCKRNGIAIEAYSPLGEGKLLENEEIIRIAEKYTGKTPAQVALRWAIQRGFIPLPKSRNSQRMSLNLDIFDFTLSDEDMTILNSLEHGCRIASDPDTAMF